MAGIINGKSHPELALLISKKSNIPLINYESKDFANTEVQININESIRGKDIYIVQTGSSNIIKFHKSVNDHIIELCLLIDTCKRADAKSITLIVPCYPYARQDKKDGPRGCISASVIAKMLETMGINRIISVDLHCAQIQGFFRKPCDNLYCIKYLSEHLKTNYFNFDDYKNKFVIISPDEGAFKRAQDYALIFNLPHMILSKERDYSTVNKVNKVVLIGHKKYLEGRTAIIVDDMCDTAGTVIKSTELLIEKGAKDVIVAVTHGILSNPAIDRINNCKHIKSFICSDSIPQGENMKRCKKLDVFTISDLLADVVKRLRDGKSVSEVFSYKN